jgi:hypothetical protein
LDPLHLGIAGWYHLAMFGLAIPWMALRSRRRVGTGPSRSRARSNVAMGAHALYNVLAGLNYGRLGERLGYPRDPAQLTAPGSPS